jgi:hypothetical protein
MAKHVPKRRQLPTKTRLVRAFKQQYRRAGFGCFQCDYLLRRFGDSVRLVIGKLVDDGFIRKCNCEALAYEIVPRERRKLIELHKLHRIWQRGSGRVLQPGDPCIRRGWLQREFSQPIAPRFVANISNYHCHVFALSPPCHWLFLRLVFAVRCAVLERCFRQVLRSALNSVLANLRCPPSFSKFFKSSRPPAEAR